MSTTYSVHDEAGRKEMIQEMDVKKHEMEVLKVELKSLKPGARVYRQQPNSNIFFCSDRDKELASCKKILNEMREKCEAVTGDDKC